MCPPVRACVCVCVLIWPRLVAAVFKIISRLREEASAKNLSFKEDLQKSLGEQQRDLLERHKAEIDKLRLDIAEVR